MNSRLANMTISDRSTQALLVTGVLSLVVLAIVGWLAPPRPVVGSASAVRAAEHMRQATHVVRSMTTKLGFRFDDAVDPNHTGLIGEEYTEITTTLGNIEAKRTTTNPAMAGMMVKLLEEAGVAAGDTIAVGCSGSFPAMAIATLAAAEALDVTPLMIISLGASSYGATRKEMTLLDILEALKREDIVLHSPVAVSLGGADDVGNEFEPEVKDLLLAKIKQSGIPLLYEPDLQKNVTQRLEKYFGPSGSRRIAAFVNIGGNYADLGTSPLILKIEPGVSKTVEIPQKREQHGVVFAMANRHIPLIHVLNIRDLVLKYGIPWDPVPLPDVNAAVLRSAPIALTSPAGIAVAVYVVLLVAILVLYRNAFSRIPS